MSAVGNRERARGGDGSSDRGPQAEVAAAAVYGTILSLAVIVAISTDPDVGAGYILGGVAVTSLVFFAAHVYAEVVSARMASADARWRDIFRAAARQEWPVVEAAIPPAIPLALGAVGVLARDTAVPVAIAVGVTELFGLGVAVGRVLGQPRLLVLASGVINASLGVLMVLLKAVLHH